jgi:hypothetical protein
LRVFEQSKAVKETGMLEKSFRGANRTNLTVIRFWAESLEILCGRSPEGCAFDGEGNPAVCFTANTECFKQAIHFIDAAGINCLQSRVRPGE